MRRILAPVQQGLTQFLKAWMGGPKDWFATGKCVMSLHREFPISASMGRQWADAMQQAIADQVNMNSDLANAMSERLSQMARAMVNQQAMPSDGA
jgi:hemoglobin